MVGSIFGFEFFVGWLSVAEPGPVLIRELLLGLIAVGLTVGWWEELWFRGYLLQNMRDGLGLGRAVAISLVLYGAIHMANPGASLLSGVLIALIGVIRVYGWISTGQLWLSMGMHAGWNFFQGPVFGYGVSGTSSDSLIRHELTGPSWITGGAFGPEAGLAVVPVLVAAFAAMWLWTRGRRRGSSTRHIS